MHTKRQVQPTRIVFTTLRAKNPVTSQDTVCALIKYVEQGDNSDPNLPYDMPRNNIEIRTFSTILRNGYVDILLHLCLPFGNAMV